MSAARLLILSLLIATTACAGGVVEEEPRRNPRNNRGTDQLGSVFGNEGLTLFGVGGGGNGGVEAAPSIGVNSFLWRATLDTVSFMPISSADPFGGVILTDWFSPTETPDERFKLNVYILDRQLRADGIRVSVFRQVRLNNGDWTDAQVAGATGRELEDTILTRARQLRIASGTTG